MDKDMIQKRFEAVKPFLDERTRRLMTAAEACAIGYGGISVVSRATGVSRQAIALGCEELQHPPAKGTLSRIRREGGGRKRSTVVDPSLVMDLESLIEPTTRGDLESPLRWTCKSLRHLATELQAMGHTISHQTVAELLHRLGYSLQVNRKTREGDDHPNRDAQFHHIHAQVKEYQAAGQPVISVDTKKGVYDIARTAGWVNVGVDHATASFAVESIRRWWHSMGCDVYPHADRLLITADGGGSSGYRARLWKRGLQNLADEIHLRIAVSYLPPGTSKWNQIEHRLLSYVSWNRRGRPLVSHEVIVNLIAATKTTAGLRAECTFDTSVHPSGIKVTDEEMAAIHPECDEFHGEWNYTIAPFSIQN